MAEERLRAFLDGVSMGELRQDSHGTLAFAYDRDYMQRADAIPLSLSMPLTTELHTQRVVRAFILGLLPESEATLVRLARSHGVSPNSPFALLRVMGRDTAGAVQIVPDDVDAPDAAIRQGQIEWLDDTALDDMLVSLATHPDDWDPSRFAGRWSLAGAQSKVALFRSSAGEWGVPLDSTPTTHILKPSIARLPGHHLNEHLCLRAAAHLGLRAARTEILATERAEVLVAERFDRRRTPAGWQRLHQEDMCQALSVVPAKKYQEEGGPGVRDIAELLAGLGGTQGAFSASQFFDYLVFNVAIGATDAHAKNFGLMLFGRSSVRLAPLYDVASYRPYGNGDAKSAMRIGQRWLIPSINRSDWIATGARLGITPRTVEERLDALVTELPSAFAQAAADPRLSPRLADQAARLVEQIVEPLRSSAPFAWL